MFGGVLSAVGFWVIKKFEFYKNYSRMWPFVEAYKWKALLGMVITIPIGMMDALIAWSLKPYMDVVILEKPSGYVLLLPLFVVFLGLMQGVFNYIATYLNAWVGGKISTDLKLVLFDKLMQHDARFFDRETSGQIQQRFNYDVDMSCNGLISNLKVFITRVVSSVSLVGVLFYNSWLLALLAVCVLGGAMFPLTTVRKKIEALMGLSVHSGANVATHYNETFSGNRVIASYNLSNYQKRRFQDTLREVFKIGMKMTRRTGLISPLMHVIVSSGIAVIIWIGTYLILNKDMTAGNFVSFLTALVMLYTPIKGLGNNYNAVQMSFLAMNRVWDVLDRIPVIRSKPDAVKLERVAESIAYTDVCFEYLPGKPVLRNVNLKVKVGQTIALVGNSGGGKTTFANLLPRFYDVTSGSITIDGVDIRDLELHSLREKIAVVFQDNFLFSGTIRENIVLGREGVGQEQIDAAVKNACLEEFIASLERGLETEIGERGVMLSGGQRQRVAIARAFLKDAPIVILDEATSALDNKSEVVVQEAITNLMKDRTVFVIAHRLSTIRNADRIVVINNGVIAEEGTHDSLLARQGVYWSLYNTQG